MWKMLMESQNADIIRNVRIWHILNLWIKSRSVQLIMFKSQYGLVPVIRKYELVSQKWKSGFVYHTYSSICYAHSFFRVCSHTIQFSTAFYIMGGTLCLKYLTLSFLPYFQSPSVFTGIFPTLEDIKFVCQNEWKKIIYLSVLMMEQF